jgi:hypothetical protein
MSDPAGNTANTARGQWSPGDNTGRATDQVAVKAADVEIHQGDGHPHAPGYTATCETCRLAGRGSLILALYDRQGAFVGFGSPHRWGSPEELPERLVDRGGRRFALSTVTPTTAIYAEAPGA